MSSVTGVNGTIKFGSVPTAMVQLKSWTLDRTGEAVENSVVGSAPRTYLPGLTSYTVGCEGFYDIDDLGQNEVVVGAQVDFVLQPVDGVVGEAEYSGSGVVTSISEGGANDGMVEVSISIQGSGALVEGVIPV